MSKTASYNALVEERKYCSRCAGVVNPAKHKDGILDSHEVGPWSLWQGNLDARVLLVGQDWGDTRYFERHHGRERIGNHTNELLVRLFAAVGIAIAPPSASDNGGGPLFFTNAVLCLKEGGLQAPVRREWFANCGANFLRPTIEIVRPAVVISLGEKAFRAICKAFGLRTQPFRAAVEAPNGLALTPESHYFPMYHPSRRILNTHRPLERQFEDWSRVRPLLTRESRTTSACS